MNEKVIANARLVLPDSVTRGRLVMRDGVIADIDTSQSHAVGDSVDFEGDYLFPGLVELHTDNLEGYLIPRPKVIWNQTLSAFFAHDAEIVAAGITTVFDSLSVGEYHDKGRLAILPSAVAALDKACASGLLRADHYLHLRCEVADDRLQGVFAKLCGSPALRLVSLMDHTPGQRQWRDTSTYRTYHSKEATWTDEEFQTMMEELTATRDACAEANAATVMNFARQKGIPMASHDDTLPEHVNEALQNGISISEFPTTMEAATMAAQAGMLVLMGAPNVVRGGSHSGNVSAIEVARNGCLGGLSSDYVPMSLLGAVFTLSDGGVMPLHEAAALVTRNTAEAVGMLDRGALIVGRRADVVRLRRIDGESVVRTVWCGGERVF